MHRKRTLILLVLAILSTSGAWYALRESNVPKGKNPDKAGKGAGAVVAVATAHATRQDIPLRLELTGRTEAYESVTVKSRVEGQVLEVSYAEGQQVRQNEVLVKLDPADFQAKLKQAEANLARSQAQLAKARLDVERVSALRTKNFVSEEKLNDTRTALAAAEANAQADAAAVELARLQAAYTSIRAPFGGIVGARLVSPGASVRANDTPLAVLNRVRPLFISFAVSEKYLPQLQSGLRASKDGMKVIISLPDAADKTAVWAEGRVRFLDNVVDPGTGTIQMKAVVANEKAMLTPGQFVKVGLILGTQANVLTIPAEAVQQGSDGTYVFVVKNGAAEVRKLRIDGTQQSRATITDGLAEGETVVTEGQLRLTAGARVQTVGGASGAAPATAPMTDKPAK